MHNVFLDLIYVLFLLNRRLLLDDSRGVEEALNETVCINNECRGLIVSACAELYEIYGTYSFSSSSLSYIMN